MGHMTRDEMQVKWMGAGEQLADDELAFMVEQNVEPGFNDHSSRTVLDAYRFGWMCGVQAACEEHKAEADNQRG